MSDDIILKKNPFFISYNVYECLDRPKGVNDLFCYKCENCIKLIDEHRHFCHNNPYYVTDCINKYKYLD